jgi:hypothetical protein
MRSNFDWRLSISTLTFVSILSLCATAQTIIDFGALPACAQPCTILQQAQALCVPPAAPATDQSIYKICFCQSAYLQPLYSTPNGVCDAFCSQPDLAAIQGWFLGFCRAPNPPVAAPPAAGSTNAASGRSGAPSSPSSSSEGNWSVSLY